MPKLPRLTGAEMVRFLEAQGFAVVRVRGSHHVMAKGDIRTVVPVHAGRVLKVGTVKGVLRDVDLSVSEFVRMWRG